MQFEVGLIGSGIQKSLSPSIHETEAAAQGLAYRYTLFDLDMIEGGTAALPAILDEMRARGFAGTNVTFPVKQAIMPLLDHLSPEAEAMGAVNTVRIGDDGLEGHNTDWWGFGENLRRSLGEAELGETILIGAGGAGAAAAYALGRMGVPALRIADADEGRAVALARLLAAQDVPARAIAMEDLAAMLPAADGLVHATPSGMARFPGLPFDADLLRPDMWVAEIVYVPLETELLRRARAIGCRTIDGGGMVVMQAARAMEIFTGVRPDVERMIRHFSGLVAA